MAAAAEALGYTPGGVSQQLAQLERAVGQDLLVRVGRHVHLTAAGEALLEHAETLLRVEAAARRAVKQATDEVAGAIRVGAFATSAATLLAQSIIAAGQRYPRLAVTGYELEVDAASNAVRRGVVDLAFGLDYPDAPIPRADGIEFVRIRDERFQLAVASSHQLPEPFRLAHGASLDWILPEAASHYGTAIRSVCRRAGFEPHVAHEITDTAVSLALVSHGLGVTPVTPMMLALGPTRGLRVIDLHDPFSRQVVLIRRVEDRQRINLAAMTEIIEQLVRRAASADTTPDIDLVREGRAEVSAPSE